jgi:hypothetical protein
VNLASSGGLSNGPTGVSRPGRPSRGRSTASLTSRTLASERHTTAAAASFGHVGLQCPRSECVRSLPVWAQKEDARARRRNGPLRRFLSPHLGEPRSPVCCAKASGLGGGDFAEVESVSHALIFCSFYPPASCPACDRVATWPRTVGSKGAAPRWLAGAYRRPHVCVGSSYLRRTPTRTEITAADVPPTAWLPVSRRPSFASDLPTSTAQGVLT